MRILTKDLKKGVTLKPEDLDDLWTLHAVVEPGDTVSGKTLRKIKSTDSEGRVLGVSKEPVHLELRAESAEFHEHTGVLRISGVVVEGPEEVPRGSHHTFNVEPGTVITVHKEEWPAYLLSRLDEATEKRHAVVVCVLDREQAIIALFESRGARIVAQLRGEVQRKGSPEKQHGTFFSELAGKVADVAARHPESKVIVASPSFWREDLAALLPADVRKRAIMASCTSATESALQEISRRPELAEALKQDRISQEMRLVERVLEAISTGAPVAYGRVSVEEAADASAVSLLLVSTRVLQEARSSGSRDVELLMRRVEKVRGEVHLIDSVHEGGRKLDAIGGIAALLRFAMG